MLYFNNTLKPYLSLRELFSLIYLNSYRFNIFGECHLSCQVNFSPGVLAFYISLNALEQEWLWDAAILRVTLRYEAEAFAQTLIQTNGQLLRGGKQCSLSQRH